MAHTRIELIRHGEPVGGRRYRGWLDDPLSDTGWRQMWDAVAQAAQDWDLVVTSPLRRCSEFARRLADRLGLELLVDAGFKEIGFGAWEGLAAAQIDADALERFYADPLANTPPGAEPAGEFFARIGDAWRALVTRHGGRRLLLVCHAGVMRALYVRLHRLELQAMFQRKFAYAQRETVVLDAGGALLHSSFA